MPSPPSNVTLRQMRAFAQVVRSGGFTAAAHRLHLTQSATSLLVRELETHLGLPLLDRTTRSVALTEAGAEFLVRAERILAEVDQAVGHSQDLLKKRRGHVTVATTPLLAATLLPGVIAEFQQAHPAVTVRLVDALTDQIAEWVARGEAALGMGVFAEVDVALRRETVLRHPLGVVLPTGSPLARGRGALAWADLAEQPLIAMTPASGFRPLIDPLFAQAGLSVSPRFEVGYLSTAVGLVEAGLGVTVVPEYAGLRLRSPRVRFRLLRDPVVQREIELLQRATHALSPSASALREMLLAHCRALQRG